MRTLTLSTILVLATLTACGGALEPADTTGPSVDAGADCHVTSTYHSQWPIQCDDAGECRFVDAGAPE